MDKRNPRKFLALGDSYTIGESVAPDERWPVQLTTALRKLGVAIDDPEIIATTGWRTDELIGAIQQRMPENDFDLVSLLIGVNNQYQGKELRQYAADFERLVDTAISHGDGQKERVFVLSVPDYGYTPFGKEKRPVISKEIDRFNQINRQIALSHGVRYFDVTPISRKGLDDPELVAADNLHPSGKMYRLWVELILQQWESLFHV